MNPSDNKSNTNLGAVGLPNYISSPTKIESYQFPESEKKIKLKKKIIVVESKQMGSQAQVKSGSFEIPQDLEYKEPNQEGDDMQQIDLSGNNEEKKYDNEKNITTFSLKHIDFKNNLNKEYTDNIISSENDSKKFLNNIESVNFMIEEKIEENKKDSEIIEKPPRKFNIRDKNIGLISKKYKESAYNKIFVADIVNENILPNQDATPTLIVDQNVTPYPDNDYNTKICCLRYKMLLCFFICIVLIAIAVGAIIAIKMVDPPRELTPYENRLISDIFYEQIHENITAEEKAIMKSGVIAQIFNEKAKQLYRWYPLFETISYWIEVSSEANFNSRHVNSTTKNNSNDSNTNKKSLFNVVFMTLGSDIKSVLLYIFINKDNESYDLNEFLSKNSTDNESNSDNNNNDNNNYSSDSNETITNGSTVNIDSNSSKNKSDYFQLNLIICNISRVGIVKVCKKPLHLESNYFMIAMNALDQFIPILNKTFINIYNTTEYFESSSRRFLNEKEKVQASNESQKIEGTLGGDYEKQNNLIVYNSSNENESNNTAQIQLQTSYEQNSLGKESNLSAEIQQLKIQKTTDIDLNTIAPKKSEINGEMNITAKKNLTIEGVYLNDEDYLCDNLASNFTIKMTIKNESEIMPEAQVKLLKTLAELMQYQEILNPIENNTIFVEKNSSDVGTVPSRILISGKVLFSHRQIIFQKNIIGINAYGYIIVTCYSSDKCSVVGMIDIAGLFSLTLFNKVVGIQLNKVMNVYKIIQYKTLHVVNGLTNLLNSTSLNLINAFDGFVGKNKIFVLSFVDTIDKAIYKYKNIFNEVSKQFSNLGGFINNTISIIKNEFFSFLQNHYNSLENNKLWFDFTIQKISAHINELQCQIKQDKSYINQSLALLPIFYETFSGIFTQKMKEYNETFINGTFFQIRNKVTEIIDNNIKNLTNENIANMISDFINRNLNPSLDDWISILNKEFQDGKVKIIMKFIQNSEKLNNTIEKYFNFLQDNTTSYCQSENSEQNSSFNILLSEKSIKLLFDSAYFNLKSKKLLIEPQKTIETLTNIIDDGISNLIDGVQIIILNSEKTFNELYSFTNTTLTNTTNFISSLMQNVFNDFNVFSDKMYGIIKKDVSTIDHLFNDVLNENYVPSEEELAEVDLDLFKIPDVIDKFFTKFNTGKSIMESTIRYFKTMFSRRILQNENSGKRRLNNMADSIYSQAFKTIVDKFGILETTFKKSKASIMDVASSFEANFAIGDADFNPFEFNINKIFANGESIFSDLIQNKLINVGKRLIEDEISSIFSIKDMLKSKLWSLLPEKEFILFNYHNPFVRQFRLATMPILIGTANVDAFFRIVAGVQVYAGFSAGELYIRVYPYAECSTGLAIYAEIIFIRMGIYFKIDFFKGKLPMKVAITIPKLQLHVRVDLDASALGFSVGAFFQILLPQIRWFCFRINFFFFKIKICLPYFWFAWSNWLIMYEFSFTLFSIKYTLIDKYLSII